jgi:RNA polymerase sigma-70 factor (ECF subfamily)
MLSDDYRVVFVLLSIEQLSVKETAEILDINEGTVKTRYFRSKRLMREKIQAYLDLAGMKLYEFGGEHCDLVVHTVLDIINRENHQF